MGIHQLYRAISSMATRFIRHGIPMSLRNICAYAGKEAAIFLLLAVSCSGPVGATNYTLIFYSADPILYADLIASATTQYAGALRKSTYANMYTFTATSKNQVLPCGGIAPCELDKDISLLVANSTRTYDYGFANGMDFERWQEVNLLHQMQGRDYVDGTCGGVPMVDTSTIRTTVCESSCLNAYNVIISTINQRWGYVFTLPGGTVPQ